MNRGVSRRITIDVERAASAGDVRVHEEEAEARVGDVFFDPAPQPDARRAGPGMPWSPWPVGALRQPAADGSPPEQPAMFGQPDRELKPDALVPGQQRQKGMGRRGADDLESARRFEGAEGADEIPAQLLEQAAKPEQAGSPEAHQRQQVAVPARGQRIRGLVAGGEPLLEERVHLGGERRARQLVREHGGEADRHRSRHAVVGERA